MTKDFGQRRALFIEYVYAKERQEKNELQKEYTFTLVFKMNRVDEDNELLSYKSCHRKQIKESSAVDFIARR